MYQRNDGLSGLHISSGLLKKVMGIGGVIAAPFTGGASLALTTASGLIKTKQKIPKDEKTASGEPYAILSAEQLVSEIAQLQKQIAAGKDVKGAQAKLIKANAYYQAGGAPVVPSGFSASKTPSTSPVLPDDVLDEVTISARPNYFIVGAMGLAALLLILNRKKGRT